MGARLRCAAEQTREETNGGTKVLRASEKFAIGASGGSQCHLFATGIGMTWVHEHPHYPDIHHGTYIHQTRLQRGELLKPHRALATAERHVWHVWHEVDGHCHLGCTCQGQCLCLHSVTIFPTCASRQFSHRHISEKNQRTSFVGTDLASLPGSIRYSGETVGRAPATPVRTQVGSEAAARREHWMDPDQTKNVVPGASRLCHAGGMFRPRRGQPNAPQNSAQGGRHEYLG